MDSLQKLFGGAAPVRVIRLFLLNPDTVFETADIVKKTDLSFPTVQKEIQKCVAAKFIIRKGAFKEAHPLKRKKRMQGKKNEKIKKRRISGFALNHTFSHLPALRMLLGGSDLIERKKILSRLSGAGTLKLVILSGVFLRAGEPGRIDALIVGENIHNAKIDRAFRAIESEMGKELQYAVMDSREFIYRFGVHDKFLRDIFDYPHEKVVNKLGI